MQPVIRRGGINRPTNDFNTSPSTLTVVGPCNPIDEINFQIQKKIKKTLKFIERYQENKVSITQLHDKISQMKNYYANISNSANIPQGKRDYLITLKKTIKGINKFLDNLLLPPENITINNRENLKKSRIKVNPRVKNPFYYRFSDPSFQRIIFSNDTSGFSPLYGLVFLAVLSLIIHGIYKKNFPE